MRVHELAKELGVTSKELLETLEQMGVSGKSASSSVPEDIVPRLRASGGKATTAPPKSREVLEPPPQPRRAKPKRVATAVKPAAPAPAEVPAPVVAEAPATARPQARKRAAEKPEPPAPSGPVLQVVHGATPQVIAEKLDRSPAEIVKILFMAGEMATATTSLTDDAIRVIADELGYLADVVGIEDELKLEEPEDEAADQEALEHAKAANVPIIVAVNKIDKDDADPNRVRTQMVERGVVPSEWGGDYEFVDVSAKANINLDALLDTILVVADLEELKGDPTGRARGTVLEAHLDKGRGPVATVLVQKGTLQVGDALIAGTAYCRIRAMQDENGRPADIAGPSKPVQILGWSHVPSAGDDFREVDDEREARHIAEEREAKTRQAELVTSRRTTLEDLMRETGRAEVIDLNLIVKADVQGSVQALEDSLLKLPQEEVKVNIVRAGAGGITENDVTLAMASDAIIVGFNVRPSAGARELAEAEGVDIRTYKVIYDAIDDIKLALSGLLKPEQRERILGEAEVRQTFRVPKL